MNELTHLGVGELLDAYGACPISPVEVLDAVAERIAEVNERVGALAARCLERARA